MPLTATEHALVQRSLDRLRKDFDAHSTYFYDALFARAPHLRSMFRDDLTGQGMKFMTTLDTIIQKLDDDSTLATQMKGLGRTHASLGVKPEHYAPMEEALIDTMRNALSGEMSPELEAAWRKAYGIVSANMIRRSGDAAA